MYQQMVSYEPGVLGEVKFEMTSGNHQQRDGIESLEMGQTSVAERQERMGPTLEEKEARRKGGQPGHTLPGG